MDSIDAYPFFDLAGLHDRRGSSRRPLCEPPVAAQHGGGGTSNLRGGFLQDHGPAPQKHESGFLFRDVKEGKLKSCDADDGRLIFVRTVRLAGQ